MLNFFSGQMKISFTSAHKNAKKNCSVAQPENVRLSRCNKHRKRTIMIVNAVAIKHGYYVSGLYNRKGTVFL